MKRLLVAVSLATSVAAGCAMVAGIEDTTTIAPKDAASKDVAITTSDDGSIPEAAPLGPPEDPNIDGGPQVVPGDDDDVLGADDAGPGTDAGDGAVVCPKPTSFVPSLSGVTSKVCNASGSLVQGGDVAGLDCFGAGVDTSKDGIAVTACVGFDFGTAKLDSAKLRLFAINQGCTYTCYSGGCDNTATARVFVGTDHTFSHWTKAGYAKVNGAAANYPFDVPAGDFNVIAVCRGSAGAQYEDLAVDGISATCR